MTAGNWYKNSALINSLFLLRPFISSNININDKHMDWLFPHTRDWTWHWMSSFKIVLVQTCFVVKSYHVMSWVHGLEERLCQSARKYWLKLHQNIQYIFYFHMNTFLYLLYLLLLSLAFNLLIKIFLNNTYNSTSTWTPFYTFCTFGPTLL